MSTPIQNRYEFVLLFDVKDGNPNGDPDAGNLPRLDAETGHGLVTDVCLKRKVRNYVGMTKSCESPYNIYIKEKAVLGRAHFEAFDELGIKLGEEATRAVPADLSEAITELDLPDGMQIVGDEEEGRQLKISAVLDKDEAKQWLKDSEIAKPLKDFISKTLKEVKARKPTQAETNQGREQMCKTFFDIRTFGAVLSLKTAPNCGQVRGPVQFTFARSITPIIALEHSITRMAVATEAEAEKQSGDNRTMGRKHTVPYGLYRTHGFISPFLAAQTGFSEEDLALFWQALINMFDHDRSAARGEMATRGLYVFKHVGTDGNENQRMEQAKLGCAAAHKLLDLVKVVPKKEDQPARNFTDFSPPDLKPGPLENYPGVELHILCS
jgi:CRISPR-associated protein Csd2